MATSKCFTHMPFPGLWLICAIVIHPAYGWSWISSHWTMEEASLAEAAIKKVVFFVILGSNCVLLIMLDVFRCLNMKRLVM